MQICNRFVLIMQIAQIHFFMRKALAAAAGERKTFRARFSRFGSKISYKGYTETTVLLTGVSDAATGKAVTGHVWFACTKGFEACHLKEGDWLQFEARIKKYTKGYVNKKIGINEQKEDYKLSHPTKIAVVKPQA